MITTYSLIFLGYYTFSIVLPFSSQRPTFRFRYSRTLPKYLITATKSHRDWFIRNKLGERQARDLFCSTRTGKGFRPRRHAAEDKEEELIVFQSRLCD